MRTKNVGSMAMCVLVGLVLSGCTAGPSDDDVKSALNIKGMNNGWIEYRVASLSRTNGFGLDGGAYTVEFRAVIDCRVAPERSSMDGGYIHRRYCEELDAGQKKSIKGRITFVQSEKGWWPVGGDF